DGAGLVLGLSFLGSEQTLEGNWRYGQCSMGGIQSWEKGGFNSWWRAKFGSGGRYAILRFGTVRFPWRGEARWVSLDLR
ncbi:MAG: hypothetical protein N3G20_07975, partial [Verrucomicrobiae bacterium]|nr:hypothetical protein [Verrucomicrobiae bacterium]